MTTPDGNPERLPGESIGQAAMRGCRQSWQEERATRKRDKEKSKPDFCSSGCAAALPFLAVLSLFGLNSNDHGPRKKGCASDPKSGCADLGCTGALGCLSLTTIMSMLPLMGDRGKKKKHGGCDVGDLGCLGCLALDGCSFLITFMLASVALIAHPVSNLRAARPSGNLTRGQTFGLTLIRWYQTQISSRTPARCLYEETCSAYGARMIREHGLLRGSMRTAGRILSCR